MIIRSNNSNLLGVFSTLCCTVLYDFEGSLEGLPIYILRNCQFPSQNWSLKRNDGYYRMLVSSMKFTCCLHNIRMPRSSKCRTPKRLAVRHNVLRKLARVSVNTLRVLQLIGQSIMCNKQCIRIQNITLSSLASRTSMSCSAASRELLKVDKCAVNHEWP